MVQIRQIRTRHQACRQKHRQEQQQHADALQPRAVIEAARGFANGVDAVGEREYRVDRLEKARRHFDRIQTRGAWDLDEHQDHADRLADVLKRGSKRVLDSKVCQRADRRGQEECRHVDRLHPYDQASRTAHDRLQNHHDRQQHLAAQETLTDRKVGDALVVHLVAHDHQQHEHADPQREIDEQRRHSRAIRIKGIEVLGLHLGGRLHELGDLGCIDATVVEERSHRTRRPQRGHVGLDRLEIGLQVGQQRIGLGQSIDR